MQEYVVGFVFSPGRSNVLLILKNRPDWMKGMWNGVGGKIETEESPQEAMSRECLEESGLDIAPEHWTKFLTVGADFCSTEAESYSCHYLLAEHQSLKSFENKTDESCLIHLCSDIVRIKTVPNLQWIVPFARQFGHRIHGDRMFMPAIISEVPFHG